MCSNTFQIPDYYSVALSEHRRIVGNETEFRNKLRNFYNLSEGLPLLGGFCRAELLRGCVDYITHNHPWRPPEGFYRGAGFEKENGYLEENLIIIPRIIPCMIVIIDGSHGSLSSGYFRSVIGCLKNCVKSSNYEICAITYANGTVRLYPRGPGGNLSLHVIGDVVDPFPSSPSSTLFASSAEVDQYLERLTRIVELSEDMTAETSEAPLSAVKVGLDIITDRSSRNHQYKGGSVILFTTSAPRCGLGSSTSTIEKVPGGTEKFNLIGPNPKHQNVRL